MDRLVNLLSNNEQADATGIGVATTLRVNNSIRDRNNNIKVNMIEDATDFNKTNTNHIVFNGDYTEINDPQTGMLAYDEQNNEIKVYNGTDWQNVGGTVEIDGSTIQGELDVNSLQSSGNISIINGNLGIGTTSPNKRLHVNGDARISGDTGIGTSNPQARLDINTGFADVQTLRVSGGTNSDHPYIAFRPAAANFLFGGDTYLHSAITYRGKVGVERPLIYWDSWNGGGGNGDSRTVKFYTTGNERLRLDDRYGIQVYGESRANDIRATNRLAVNTGLSST